MRVTKLLIARTYVTVAHVSITQQKAMNDCHVISDSYKCTTTSNTHTSYQKRSTVVVLHIDKQHSNALLVCSSSRYMVNISRT